MNMLRSGPFKATSIISLGFVLLAADAPSLGGEPDASPPPVESSRTDLRNQLRATLPDDLFSLAVMQDESEPAISPFRKKAVFTIRPQYWQPQFDGHLSLDDSFGIATELDFESDLGIEDPNSDFAWDLGIQLGASYFKFSGYTLDGSSLETANQSITFGDITIDVNDLFDVDLDLKAYKFQAGLLLLNMADDGFDLGIAVGVDYYQVDASITDVSSSLGDEIDEDIPIPVLGLHLALPISDFLVTAEASGLTINVEGIDVTYLDASLSLTWMPIDGVGVIGGYRIITFDFDDGDFVLDATLDGLFFGLEFRF